MKLEWRLWGASQVVGLTLVLIGWVQASGDLRPKGQIGPLNLGIAGATVAVAASLRLLARGRRAVTARQVAVLAPLLPSTRRERGGARSTCGRRPPPRPGDALVSSPTMTRYHRTGCLLVAAKPVAPAPLAEHQAAGRQPCGVCTP